MLRIARPTPALVVAFVALFTALGGSSYAAIKITGKNVVNSTLTGADVKAASLGPSDIRPDSLDGKRIDESTLATVPSAQSAANAANADAVGGIPAASLMTVKDRTYETTIAARANFANNAVMATTPDLPPGEYLVTARLTYDNDGAAEQETCTLQVPSTDDTSTFIAGTGTDTVHLMELVSSDAVFNAAVSCSGDGDDDTLGSGTIIAVRVD